MSQLMRKYARNPCLRIKPISCSIRRPRRRGPDSVGQTLRTQRPHQRLVPVFTFRVGVRVVAQAPSGGSGSVMAHPTKSLGATNSASRRTPSQLFRGPKQSAGRHIPASRRLGVCCGRAATAARIPIRLQVTAVDATSSSPTPNARLREAHRRHFQACTPSIRRDQAVPGRGSRGFPSHASRHEDQG